MQRYHVANCSSAVNNSSIGGPSSRDTARAESSAVGSNFPLRRQYQLSPYKLKCEKEPLNSRLGPPDYHPQTTDCPEETLTKEYVQTGYKETVEGLEEAREISLTQVQAFGKPIVLKCKEAIRKRLRAINESRAQKRKAGQVYGVPLSGSLLSKTAAFPEQRPCGEDFRKRWIEALSQPHKRLRSLGEHVPHGYRKKSLVEVLIKNNVPILRATWFIKVTYLNQVRPGSAAISSGAPDRSHLSRAELWTKDVIDYLQNLLDEFRRNNYNSNSHLRERSPQMLYAGPTQQKNEAASSTFDGDEPSLHFKWWYMVRLLQWHHTEGLVLPSPIIDWVLSQLQEKELFETLQLVLPIIHAVIEAIVLSQAYVRTLVGVAVRFICEPSPGGSDLVDNSRREYTCSAVVEMLRYLILAVPDTFVALDCFPLPPNVVSYTVNDGGYLSKASEDIAKMEMGSAEVACLFRRKGFDAFYQAVSFGHVVSSIQRHADKLAKVVSSGNPSCGYARAVQVLDKALVHGDLKRTYKFLFEDVCEEAVDGGWIAEVSPSLRSSLKWIGSLKLSFIYSVFFLCEWATCDFRNSRTAPLADVKFSGRKDFSQVYVAVLFLKLKKRDLENSSRRRNDNVGGVTSHKGLSQENNFGRTPMVNVLENGNNTENVDKKNRSFSGGSNGPGPLHDILVCWIDQHELPKGEGFERLQLLIVELTRCGIFNPPAYVRQLLISGIMGLSGHLADRDRQMRHYRVLKQLPEILVHDALEEARIADGRQFLETMHVYLSERRLVLRELCGERRNLDDTYISTHKKKHYFRSGPSPTSVDQWKVVESPSSSFSPKKADIEEVNTLISNLMQFPNSISVPLCMGTGESEWSIKRTAGSMSNKLDFTDSSPGCEECRRVKKQKLTEERSAYIQVHSPMPSDDEDLWWVRKGPKSSESLKVDPPLKSTKQASRGRQKVVRKTQSLAQLAAARIEGSQGASTSHVCDSRTSCSHHGTGVDGEIPKSVDGTRVTHSCDVITVGKALKQLRIAKRRVVTFWLLDVVKQLIEEAEKTSAQVGQFNRTFTSLNDRSTLRWKLSEDDLSNILYLLDVSDDLVSAVKFILWLLPKTFRTSSLAIHGGRNVPMLQRQAESHVCEIREMFLLSFLRRYESTLIAADLIPQALSVSMDLVATVVTSNGRMSGTSALGYARYLLKKYGNVTSVLEWRKTPKANRDKRLLAELEGRTSDGEFGFPLGIPAGVDDLDDFIRQKMSTGRLSRVGMNLREIVQKRVDEALHFFSGKEKKVFAAGVPKGPSVEKGDDGFQISEQIVGALMDCMKQTGGAAQEGDPSLVSSAISAIVGSVGPALAKIPDFTAGGSYTNSPSSTSSFSVARQILRINITCLCLLREALGERQGRVFEIALATEASSALAGVFSPGKSSRTQYQLSPEAHDSNSSTSGVVGRATKVIAAVSALIIGAVIQGITSLERMISVFRLKEGIDVVQFMRSIRSNSNGSIRSPGTFKVESPIEVYVHWFRLLVGNCRTVSDGLVVELLGESSIVALSRMQQTLPIGLVFPPAYSIMAFLMWRPFILNSNLAAREDIHQLYQSLSVAMNDAIKHLPFRDVCLRDSVGLYDLVSADTVDSEFASILELNGTDSHLKSIAFVPLRARLFVDAIISCRIPALVTQDDRSRITGHGDPKDRFAENKTKLLDRIVHVLNTLQPAKFHWQWLELRLLLNEQALIEKLEAHDMTLVDAIRSLAPSSERDAVSENENNFIEIILTRLLVRPDAASLFSEVVHLFGRSLQDSMLLLTKWFLEGHDVLFGRKTIRQRLMNIAESKGLSIKPQISKHWGWSTSGAVTIANSIDKKKHEVASIEEGEVVEEGADPKKFSKGSIQVQLDAEGYSARSMQQFATEKALIELVLPCIDQSSDESRNTFASDLIKQLNAIEQHISLIARVTSKNTGTAASGTEGPAHKSSNRKGMRGGSPGLARRQAAAAAAAVDSAPPPPPALRASVSLRLHFLMRLLPIICADREPLGRNMRHMLASVILRLLGNQLVYDYEDSATHPLQTSPCKREGELPVEAPGHNAPSNFLGETLFDRLLLVLHGLLSSSQPSWLKPKLTSKSAPEYIKDFAGLDKEAAENLLNELDNMQLPDKIRWRIQAAMPFLHPSVRCSVSCQPPSVPVAVLTTVQSTISLPGGASSGNLNPLQRNPVSSARSSTTTAGKSRLVAPQQDYNIEVDAWTLLEDGVGGGPSSSSTAGIGGADNANLRAASWLKGAVRVRRADLTYVGAVDDDS